jgi:hypothetical protein
MLFQLGARVRRYQPQEPVDFGCQIGSIAGSMPRSRLVHIVRE